MRWAGPQAGRGARGQHSRACRKACRHLPLPAVPYDQPAAGSCGNHLDAWKPATHCTSSILSRGPCTRRACPCSREGVVEQLASRGLSLSRACRAVSQGEHAAGRQAAHSSRSSHGRRRGRLGDSRRRRRAARRRRPLDGTGGRRRPLDCTGRRRGALDGARRRRGALDGTCRRRWAPHGRRRVFAGRRGGGRGAALQWVRCEPGVCGCQATRGAESPSQMQQMQVSADANRTGHCEQANCAPCVGSRA